MKELLIVLLGVMILLMAFPIVHADIEYAINYSGPVIVRAGHPEPIFSGCYISSKGGLLKDIDCDKVPDAIDNCPLMPNPDQIDQTKNGIGDACDLVIESIKADPPVLTEGRAFIVDVSLFNFREYSMRNLIIRAEIPELGVSVGDNIGIIKSGERVSLELPARLKGCIAARDYDLVVIVEYPFAAGKKEIFSQSIRVPVKSTGACNGEPPTKTVINVGEVQDLDPIKGGAYPFTVHNMEPFGKAYVLSVDNLDWGSYEIEPRRLLVISGGGTANGVIKIVPKKGVTGQRSFTLIAKSSSDVKEVMLTANIPVKPGTSRLKTLYVVLIILAIIVVVFAILLVSGKIGRRKRIITKRSKKKKNNKKENNEKSKSLSSVKKKR